MSLFKTIMKVQFHCLVMVLIDEAVIACLIKIVAIKKGRLCLLHCQTTSPKIKKEVGFLLFSFRNIA